MMLSNHNIDLGEGDMTARTPAIRSSAALGRVLRIDRERQGLTQSELARKAGATRWAVLNLEAGHETQAMRTLFEITAALGLEFTIRAISDGS